MIDSHAITSLEELEALYGAPVELSLIKELDHISDHYRAFIETSPFVAVASCCPDGHDCSPRGDPAGFVRVADEKTVMLPDRRGNHRLDALKNIVADPCVALLFLVHGVGETMRINGRAMLSTDALRELRHAGQGAAQRHRGDGRAHLFQCQKVLARSCLWDPEARVDPRCPRQARWMAQALSEELFDGAAYGRGLS